MAWDSMMNKFRTGPDYILKILDGLDYDPNARPTYEYLSGGLMWPDERPSERPLSLREDLYSVLKPAFAYRASLMLGKPRHEFRHVWDQIVKQAPNWPGLHPDRQSEKYCRYLTKRSKALERCLDELEENSDVVESQDSFHASSRSITR